MKIISVLTLPLIALFSCTLLDESDIHFIQQPLEIANYKLFDLGVVDIDNDGFLDIFSTNHNALQNLLLNDGHKGYTDIVFPMRLSQSLEFPGLEDSPLEPSMNAPGVYVYWHELSLVIRGHSIRKVMSSFSGRIRLSSNLKDIQESNFISEVNEDSLPSGLVQATVKVEAFDDGHLKINPHFQGIPVRLQLDSQVPLDHVYIGSRKVNAPSHDFEMALRDRHGMAWFDVNDDGFVDVFITRGGLKGEMAKFPETYLDELLLNTGDGFASYAEQSGIIKENCPGRQAAWVDVDGDGRIELFVACASRNQFYRHLGNTRFVNIAKEVGLDRPGDGRFVWLDVENDGDIDLFFAEGRHFALYLNESRTFERQLIGRNKDLGDNTQLTVSDYDLDGDLDIFATTLSGNTLLLNEGGSFSPANPGTFGLPKNGVCANWVDYDNDGLPDLHIMPGGLYRQQPDHYFTSTNLLAGVPGSSFRRGMATWFDADNDGYRDCLFAVLPVDSAFRGLWTAGLYRNTGSRNHWLEVRLRGPSGNRQAIGARVKVKTPAGSQLQQVGSAEGSLYSQGHYRLYFGLGSYEKADALQIVWPDGRLQEIKSPHADQLLDIAYDAAN